MTNCIRLMLFLSPVHLPSSRYRHIRSSMDTTTRNIRESLYWRIIRLSLLLLFFFHTSHLAGAGVAFCIYRLFTSPSAPVHTYPSDNHIYPNHSLNTPKLQSGDTFMVEIDLRPGVKRTMYLFCKDTQTNCSVDNLPETCSFGVTLWNQNDSLIFQSHHTPSHPKHTANTTTIIHYPA